MHTLTQSRKSKGRSRIKRILAEAFREAFPTDTVDVSDGFDDLVHVVVISRKFDKMTAEQRDALMWKILDQAPLTKEEKLTVSLLRAVSFEELKHRL